MENKQVVEIEMLRRITGYLVPNVNRWSDGKKAELKDRVKHAGGDTNGLYKQSTGNLPKSN